MDKDVWLQPVPNPVQSRVLCSTKGETAAKPHLHNKNQLAKKFKECHKTQQTEEFTTKEVDIKKIWKVLFGEMCI